MKNVFINLPYLNYPGSSNEYEDLGIKNNRYRDPTDN